MGIRKVDEVQLLFSQHGVTQVFVKYLAPKQDNEKNQINLGRGLDGVANLFPSELIEREASTSTKKVHSNAGAPIVEAKLDLHWLSNDGSLHSAPHAKIIDYFQYPEVRISGFLKGCDAAPDALRRRNQSKYGQRILLLGVADARRTIGMVLTEANDPLVAEFPDLPALPIRRLLKVMVFGEGTGQSPRDLLHRELSAIHAMAWQPSITLKPGDVRPVPFKGNQGGGYTLEALLSVPRNAEAAPDKYGYEIKSFTKGKKISLMTPTADAGYEGDNSFRDFMSEYGTARDDGSVALSGVYRCNQPNKKTGFVMRIEGYDSINDTLAEDTKFIRVVIRDEVNDIDVSAWSFSKLASKWSKKHASACYVPRDRRIHDSESAHDFDYHFRDHAYFCEGTSIRRLFRAIHEGSVFYDPAHRIYADGKAKQRPQWRMNTTRFEKTLADLYSEVAIVQLD
jgi:MvaI/BcnI restriction endonuclease family